MSDCNKKKKAENLEKIFEDICLKKRTDETRPLKLVIFNNYQILHVINRRRKDIPVVSQQLHHSHAISRSGYADYLWNTPTFKS